MTLIQNCTNNAISSNGFFSESRITATLPLVTTNWLCVLKISFYLLLVLFIFNLPTTPRILDNGEIYTPDVNMKRRDANSILREVMHTAIRPYDVTEKLNAFSKAIEDENLDTVQKILDELRVQLGDNDSEVVGAQITLDLERI